MTRKYLELSKYLYKNGKIVGGLVKNSPHKENEIYFSISSNEFFDITVDEALSIISVLSHALWTNDMHKRKRLIFNNKWKCMDYKKIQQVNKDK